MSSGQLEPADALDRVRRHLDESGGVVSLDGLLFTTRTGQPISYTTWRSRRWRRIVERADVGALRPHDLRHTAATRLFTVDRWSPAEVQAFLGHSDPRLALQVYTHVNAGSLPSPSVLPQFSGSWSACGPGVAQRWPTDAESCTG